jgi:signal transduction histidine kinase/CheY-like chemotaxis protein
VEALSRHYDIAVFSPQRGRFVTLFSDITHRKEMQSRLRRQERLAAVGQLSAGIAHDFRNLLTTVVLYANMDRRNPDVPDSVKQHLMFIIEEMRKASTLVQQILDFSSNAMLEPRPADLKALVRGVLDDLRPTLAEDVHLSLDVADGATGAYTVMADSERIEQALTNLIHNAQDAMPEGGEIHCGLSRDTYHKSSRFEGSPRTWIRLTVSDTGIGMTEALQTHLFEPFFTTKDIDKGRGLGLAQVFGIVRQHAGFIDVESEPGIGTTFTLYFPPYSSEDEAEEVADPTYDTLDSSKTILLVEDDNILRSTVKQALEKLDYRVIAARNGREALALCQVPRWSELASSLRASRVDVVVTDLALPEMSGEDLIRELRAQRPKLIAIAITERPTGQEERLALEQAGFAVIITKPFNPDSLAQAVERLLT